MRVMMRFIPAARPSGFAALRFEIVVNDGHGGNMAPLGWPVNSSRFLKIGVGLEVSEWGGALVKQTLRYALAVILGWIVSEVIGVLLALVIDVLLGEVVTGGAGH